MVREHVFDYQRGYPRAVPTVRELTAVRAEPDEDAERVTEALPGEPLTVAETRDGWAHVRTAYDYPGWLPVDALGGEPDPAWLERTADEPLTHARALLGVSYRWGGMSAAGIDCSGLVHMSFRATGRLVPRDADQQEDAGTRVTADELRAGVRRSVCRPSVWKDRRF